MKSMSRPIVELKGYRDGLRLIIDPAAPIEEIESLIRVRMENLGDSLAGITMNIDVGSRSLSGKELDRLRTLLHETYGLEVKQIIDESNSGPQPKDNRRIISAPALHQDEHVVNNSALTQREETVLIRNTLRSGQVERFLEGNIVILGDVNPGAEITAAGDIIVLGTLRGIAHAGALGNTSSVIIALNLMPTQLRIGRFITRPPSGKQKSQEKAEIARVTGENVIIVEEFNGL